MKEALTVTPTDKGERGGECNRRACRTRPATCFNRGTDKFYCIPCAQLINQHSRGLVDPPLCTITGVDHG